MDADYRGNIGVVLFNHGSEDFVIKEGDRIAQLICERILYPSVQEVEVNSILLYDLFIGISSEEKQEVTKTYNPFSHSKSILD